MGKISYIVDCVGISNFLLSFLS